MGRVGWANVFDGVTLYLAWHTPLICDLKLSSNHVITLLLSQMLHELVVSTSAQSTGNGSILFHDIQSGASLASFKHTNAAKNCTALIPTRESQGGLMLAVQPDKALLNVYSFQKVLLLVQEPPSVIPLTFFISRIKSPKKSFSRNDSHA